MTSNVMTASSGQSNQTTCGPAVLHINRRTSESQMTMVIFTLGTLMQNLKLDYINVFQVMTSVFGSFSSAEVLRDQRLSAHSFVISSRLCSYTQQSVCFITQSPLSAGK